jgi:hypothetical protein
MLLSSILLMMSIKNIWIKILMVGVFMPIGKVHNILPLTFLEASQSLQLPRMAIEGVNFPM